MSDFPQFRLLWKSWLDLAGASLTASSEAGGDYVVENLLDPDPDLVLRTADADPLVLTATLDKARPINAAPFCAHNLSTGATILTEVATDAGFTDIVMTQTDQAVKPIYGYASWPGYGVMRYGGYDDDEGGWKWGYTPIWYADSAFQRYIRWTVTDPNNTDGYIQIGRLMAGKYWTAAGGNFEWGYAFGWRRNAEVPRSRAGAALIPSIKRAYRAGGVPFAWLTASDISTLHQIERELGAAGDVFWSAYPERGGRVERDNAALCVITDWDLPNEPNAAQGMASFNLEEIYDHG